MTGSLLTPNNLDYSNTMTIPTHNGVLGSIWPRHRANHRFALLSDSELGHLPPVRFLVDKILPEGCAAALIGGPASLKSFIALAIAMCIATGMEWMGFPLRRGRVLYIAAEGGSGYRDRVEAWKIANNFDGEAGVDFLIGPVNLLSSNDIDALLDLMQLQVEPYVLVIFDTFARCFVNGDENSARDVGVAISSIDRIRNECGAAVLVVHHSRKGDDVERGSSALRGALDMAAHTKREGESVTLTCGKMKDGPEFDDVRLRLIPTEPSAILQRDSVTSAHREEPQLSPRAKQALDVLGDDPVTYSEWRYLAISAGIPESTFDRMPRNLKISGFVQQLEDGRYLKVPEERDTEMAS
ncbi:MAG: DnaB domain protein helicase domain protein [Gemmatimonadetes bacterium]|nr:DnaB domain protein helicase domain protein [Gemmatimonadota bacterium]